MIDLMVAEGKTPIIVGDEPDMAELVTFDRNVPGVGLAFRNAKGDPIPLNVPATMAAQLEAATHLCVVGLSGDGIAYARMMDLRSGAGWVLAEAEMKRLAEAMAADDFELTHLARDQDKPH